VLGNAPGLNYASDYRNVSGVVVPTKRRVFAYDSEKRKIPGAPLVAIDVGEIAFALLTFAPICRDSQPVGLGTPAYTVADSIQCFGTTVFRPKPIERASNGAV
jgi:hypothetical protein